MGPTTDDRPGAPPPPSPEAEELDDELFRCIRLQGCRNFRDLGGYVTRWGASVRWRRVFRSDSLHRMTARDARTLERDLGVRTVVDLRSMAELEAFGWGPLEGSRVRHRHLPLEIGLPRGADGPWTDGLLGLYRSLAGGEGRRLVEALDVLADPRVLPAVVFCGAGKDRTGVVAALLLGALGVPDEAIVVDYARTRPVDPEGLEAPYRTLLRDLPGEFHGAPRSAMEGLLEEIRRRHGSLRAYAAAHGLSLSRFQALERGLLTYDD